MRLNRHPEKLRVGMLVVTEFHYDECHVVRELTRIEKDENFGSGYRAWASGGLLGQDIEGVDASWFEPAPQQDIDDACTVISAWLKKLSFAALGAEKK